MKIVADENIPLVRSYFADHTVLLKAGRDITHSDLMDADMLLIRSVTRVDKELLQNTPVKFVGSATAGMDHLDVEWLEKNHIKWAVAKGCNARSVVEYVVCVMAALQKMQLLADKKLRIGVVGIGQIGQGVVDILTTLGHEVIQCDPLRAQDEKGFISTPIEQLVDLDFISLHTPLTHAGRFPTFHLIDKNFLQRQKKNCVLLNAGRGAVIDSNDLKLYGEHLLWCLDVFEGEPNIDFDILDSTVLATPHIAGYSAQSKYRGMQMIYDAAVQEQVFPNHAMTKIPLPTLEISLSNRPIDWRDIVLNIFDPRILTKQLKTELIKKPAAFDQLRKNFTARFEFEFVHLHDIVLSEQDTAILEKLNFTIKNPTCG